MRELFANKLHFENLFLQNAEYFLQAKVICSLYTRGMAFTTLPPRSKSAAQVQKEDVMKAKRIRYCLMMLAMLGAFAAGCGNNVETQEEIITLKEEKEDGEDTEKTQETEQAETENKRTEGIAEQVQAPERYEAELSDKGVYVKVDAEVRIPDGEGFKSYRVKGRPFRQADYEAVSSVLLNGEKLWERDMEAMAESNGFTRQELEQKIERLEEEHAKARKEGPEAENLYREELGKDYEEELVYLTEMLEKAPDEPALVEVESTITVDDGVEETEDNARKKEAGTLSGKAVVDGTNYWLSLNNMFHKEWHWNIFSVIQENKESRPDLFQPLGQTEGGAGFSLLSSLPIDEIREDAEVKVQAMGFTDFMPTAEEYFGTYKMVDSYGKTEIDRIGYGFHFTRVLDGIPVTYAGWNQGTAIEDGENLVWPYESLTLTYSEDGLANFRWENPYEIETVSDEYLFLLPFSEIQNIFEEMMIKKYQDWIGESDVQMDFQINEVRLGYMRIREKGNIEEGMMVPVWDFFGTRSTTYGEGEAYDENSAFYSWLTINALDGTIIDRGFGY